MLNRRPLTEIPLEGPDDEVLTPFHFIFNCAGDAHAPVFPSDDLRVCGRNDWLQASERSLQWWDKWCRDYLSTLRTREYWNKEVEPIDQGDVVVVCDPKKPRQGWVKARVLRIMPSKDGVPRSALIKTEAGTYIRPVSFLAKLDVQQKPQANDPKERIYIGLIREGMEDLQVPIQAMRVRKWNEAMKAATRDMTLDRKERIDESWYHSHGSRERRDLDAPEGGDHDGFCPKCLNPKFACSSCEELWD